MDINNKTIRLFQYLAIILLTGNFFYSCSDKNEEEEIIPAMSIAITSDKITIGKLYVDWMVYILSVEIENPISDNIELVWTSEDPSIVTIDDNDGKLYVHGFGSTNVKVTIVGTNISATCLVTVVDTYQYIYRLTLKDKGKSDFNIERPEQFLSPLAIEKRKQRNIGINKVDLPISQEYIKEIEKIGGTIVSKSKWLNTVSIYCSDEYFVAKYKELAFVQNVEMVWIDNKDSDRSEKTETKMKPKMSPMPEYGEAWDNINTNKGQVLHQQGFRGEGIDIAVIDGGFDRLNTNVFLDNIKIKGAKSFIREKQDPYDRDTGEHGVWVTSCMATNKANKYIGTAPEASYWLLSSEDQDSEYPIEEDYLVAALEYADSVGVDIANMSLGYSWYGWGIADYTYEEMDGKTAFATKGANIAASKGMFIVNSAGNDRTWVGAPADSPNVLTVGNIETNGKIGYFSSYGMTVDGRIKPDVVALGTGVNVVYPSGNIGVKSGTSFSSPVICGLAACLWQAYPELTNMELMDVIRKSADRYTKPELPYGYGIPNMEKAMELAKEKVKNHKKSVDK